MRCLRPQQGPSGSIACCWLQPLCRSLAYPRLLLLLLSMCCQPSQAKPAAALGRAASLPSALESQEAGRGVARLQESGKGSHFLARKQGVPS